MRRVHFRVAFWALSLDTQWMGLILFVPLAILYVIFHSLWIGLASLVAGYAFLFMIDIRRSRARKTNRPVAKRNSPPDDHEGLGGVYACLVPAGPVRSGSNSLDIPRD